MAKTDRQWRRPRNSAGHEQAQCRYCRRTYILPEPSTPSIQSNTSAPPACPKCGSDARQWKTGLTSRGNQTCQCSVCRARYTIGGSNRAPVKSRCPSCNQTTRQHRRYVSVANNLTIHCGHCNRNYTVQGNDPDYRQPPDPIPLPSAPPPENPFAGFLPPHGTYDW